MLSILSLDVATPIRDSEMCASGVPSPAVNRSNGNSSEGQLFINKMKREEAVVVMDAQVSNLSSPVSAVFLNQAWCNNVEPAFICWEMTITCWAE